MRWVLKKPLPVCSICGERAKKDVVIINREPVMMTHTTVFCCSCEKEEAICASCLADGSGDEHYSWLMERHRHHCIPPLKWVV